MARTLSTGREHVTTNTRARARNLHAPAGHRLDGRLQFADLEICAKRDRPGDFLPATQGTACIL